MSSSWRVVSADLMLEKSTAEWLADQPAQLASGAYLHAQRRSIPLSVQCSNKYAHKLHIFSAQFAASRHASIFILLYMHPILYPYILNFFRISYIDF
jgi:hypothetical protein